jgi:hypothetical protein
VTSCTSALTYKKHSKLRGKSVTDKIDIPQKIDKTKVLGIKIA